jgi:hypothetical protein
MVTARHPLGVHKLCASYIHTNITYVDSRLRRRQRWICYLQGTTYICSLTAVCMLISTRAQLDLTAGICCKEYSCFCGCGDLQISSSRAKARKCSLCVRAKALQAPWRAEATDQQTRTKKQTSHVPRNASPGKNELWLGTTFETRLSTADIQTTRLGVPHEQ